VEGRNNGTGSPTPASAPPRRKRMPGTAHTGHSQPASQELGGQGSQYLLLAEASAVQV